MKLLKICVTNLPLFKEKTEFDFTSGYNISDYNDDGLYEVFPGIYTNNVISIVGINASGKTALLKLLSFVMELLNGNPINNNSYISILNGTADGDKVVFETYFSLKSNVYYLNTAVRSTDGCYYIDDEILKHKPAADINNKDSLFNSMNWTTDYTQKEKGKFLKQDVSIIAAIIDKYKSHINYVNMLPYTDVNTVLVKEDVRKELLNFLDPTIEYLKIQALSKDTVDIRLKFKNKKEKFVNNFNDLNKYLSAGTIRGINFYTYAKKMFDCGGYMLIDEIGNHLDRGVAGILVQFFLDKNINPKGAALLFSTHSADMLDLLDRNDSVYITRNGGGISVDNLSNSLQEEADDKSDIYLSNYLGGTALEYEHYKALLFLFRTK